MINILMTALFIAILIYILSKLITKLTKYQIFGTGTSYLATMTAMFIFIYYGGN